jgi:hypothetical protein
MNVMAGNWVWMLAFFPLWLVMAGVWFSLVSVPKRSASASMKSFLDGSATLLSICTAGAILVSLNCNAMIRLPLADPACHTATFELGSLSFLEQLIPFR